jgi:succinate dehydrogenase / fumarate reductase cytochrome b subunit
MKALMAVTGLIMIGFLLMHMYGNLKMFMGPEAFNHYAHWLKFDPHAEGGSADVILYPLIPNGWFIWIFRFVLLAAIVLHIYSAATLWRRAKVANPSAYQAKKALAQTYSARTMRWGGIILAGFLVFHLLQFTALVLRTGFEADAAPYDAVVASFSQWWVVIAYALWLVAVCMHVRHGFWSAFTTLGANTSPKARAVLNGCAWIVAILLYIGFMIMPLAVVFKVIS